MHLQNISCCLSVLCVGTRGRKRGETSYPIDKVLRRPLVTGRLLNSCSVPVHILVYMPELAKSSLRRIQMERGTANA